MQNVKLFIDKYLADLDNVSSIFALTYSFSDIYSPDTITDDYSKTITLPGTDNNNKIFRNLWDLRSSYNSELVFVDGLNYNPSKRVNFSLYIDNELFKTGYIKLNKIKIEKYNKYSYEITLYGNIANFFYTLLNGDTEDPSCKLLSNLKWPYDNLKHVINKKTINYLWNTWDSSLNDYMNYVIGYQGYYDNFNSGKWATGIGPDYKIVDITSNGQEFTPFEIGQYLSYQLKPAVRIKPMIDLIFDQANYVSNLDPAFFNNNNPYYSKSVLTLNNYITDNVESEQSIGLTQQDEEINTENSYDFPVADYIQAVADQYYNFDVNYTSATITLQFGVYISAHFPDAKQSAWEWEYRLPGGNVEDHFYVNVYAYNRQGDRIATVASGPNRFDIYYRDTGPWTPNYNLKGFRFWHEQYVGGITNLSKWFELQVQPKQLYDSSNGKYPFYASGPDDYLTFIPIQIKYNGNLSEIYRFRIEVNLPSRWQAFYNEIRKPDIIFAKILSMEEMIQRGFKPNYTLWNQQDLTINYYSSIRSNSTVTYNDMIQDDETTQGQFLIEYCKLFGLLFDSSKNDPSTISIMTRNTYFKDYQILDWTKKVDYSKTFEINPLTFDKKYYVLQYNNSGSFLEDQYKTKYNAEFGSIKLNTGYEFNAESDLFFSDTIFNNSVMAQLKSNWLVSDGSIISKVDTKIMPVFYSGQNKEFLNSKFNLLFDNDMVSNNDKYSQFYIIDDYNYNNVPPNDFEYCYIDTKNVSNQYWTKYSNYRRFTTFDNQYGYSFLFNAPKYLYYDSSSYNNYGYIYGTFWQSYLSDIYNVNSKIVTCYVYLDNNEMKNWSFKNFVMINNVLFHPNKIIDYNPLNNESTKVELIKVNNINNYINSKTFN